MSRHRAPRPRRYWWQKKRHAQHLLHTFRVWLNEQMTDLQDIRAELKNSVIEILNLQNQVASLEQRIAPFIESDPLNPEVVKVRLQIEFTKGQLHTWLEVAEKLSLSS